MGWSPPSGGGGGGGISTIASGGGISVTNPTGPTTTLSVLLSGLQFTETILTAVTGTVALIAGELYIVKSMIGNAIGLLPSAATSGSSWVILTRQENSGNSLLLSPQGTDTLASVAGSQFVSSGEAMWAVSDGVSNWVLI